MVKLKRSFTAEERLSILKEGERQAQAKAVSASKSTVVSTLVAIIGCITTKTNIATVCSSILGSA